MKGKWILSFVALSSLTLLPAVSLSASASQENPPPDKGKKVRTVTGCLTKGDSANEYQLTTKNGGTWEVKSDASAVNFTEHMGHTVRLTGTVNNATAHGLKEKAKEKTSDTATEHGHMTVTNLKMVSETCSQ
jgi:hypothetical protein